MNWFWRPKDKVNKRILLRIFLRTYFVGATFNTKGMQNVGFFHAMDPGLQALFGHNPLALKQARARYLKHYNSHPFWAPLLAGIFLSMEQKIAAGLLPAKVLPQLRLTTTYTLSALGDSFFGGSFLVMWSLIAMNFAVLGWYWPLALWIVFCFLALQLFRIYTFARGYAQGLSFLQQLKSWDLINWGQRIKIVNGVLLALFFVHIVPQGFFYLPLWATTACLLALASSWRTMDRLVIFIILGLAGLAVPWDMLCKWLPI